MHCCNLINLHCIRYNQSNIRNEKKVFECQLIVAAVNFFLNYKYGITFNSSMNYIESVNNIIYSSSNPPTLTQIVGTTTLFNNNGSGGYTFNAQAIAASVNAATVAGSTNILVGLPTSTGSEIYCCRENGRTYPIDNSSTMSVRQDIANTKYMYLDLNPSVLSNYINNVVNDTTDTAQNIKLSVTGNKTLTLDYSNLLGNLAALGTHTSNLTTKSLV